MSDHVAEFMAFTGANATDAQNYLEMAGGDLGQAVSLYMDMHGGAMHGGSPQRGPAATGGGGGGGGGGRGAGAHTGGDLGDFDLDEEMRAMSQEEPDVRAPMASFQDQLIDTSSMAYQHAAQHAQAKKKQQTVVGNLGQFASAKEQDKDAFGKLFGAPREIICALPWDEAKEQARTEKKWLLVNIQKEDEFISHVLNRDVWSDETIQDLLSNAYSFWQRSNKSDEGRMFEQLYKIPKLPYIGIIDPRTGRQIKTWEPKLFKEPYSAADILTGFLDSHSLATHNPAQAHSAQPSPPAGPMASPPSGPHAPAASSGSAAAPPKTTPAPEPVAAPPLAVPPEPTDADGPTARVRITLPDGKTHTRRVLQTNTLGDFFVVCAALAGKSSADDINVDTTMPKMSLRGKGLDTTVEAAQLSGAAVRVSDRLL